MGPALLLLSVADHIKGFARKFVIAFGQVPLFFFVIHILLISGTSWLWVHFQFNEQVNIAFASAKQFPAGYEPSLMRTYILWMVVVIVLYFPCRWYSNYKRNNKNWWLSYVWCWYEPFDKSQTSLPDFRLAIQLFPSIFHWIGNPPLSLETEEDSIVVGEA